MANPWYSCTQDSPGGGYGETLEPLDPHYKKPDTNLQVPAGTPITALLSGTVTDVSDRGKSAGGLSVTVRLKDSINSVATHISYNYLGSTQVSKEQPVQAGQTIGIAGSPTGIFTAVALGSDDVWGSGPGFDLNAKGDPRLDPRPVLAAAMGEGTPPIDLTDPIVAGYFTQTPDGQWKCKQTGFIVRKGILKFYRSFGQNAYCGLTYLGLPKRNEEPIAGHSGAVKQLFERAVVAYDPTHQVDHPPDAKEAYLMHLPN
jgi:hypothetical protein